MKRIQLPPLSASLCIAAVLAAISYPASAATIAYTNDFSGTGSNVGLTTAGDTGTSFTLTGSGATGAYSSSNSSNATARVSGATISLTNANDRSFTMEMEFSLSAAPGNSNGTASNLGFTLFGSDAGNATVGSFYYASFVYSATGTSGTNLPGTLNMVMVNGGAPNGLSSVVTNGGVSGGGTGAANLSDANSGSSNLAVVVGDTYRLRLQANYISVSDDLQLTLSLWNAAGTTQIGGSATATALDALTGTEFGIRHRSFSNTGASTAVYDNFSVVPEPGITAYAVFGLGAMLLMRRRRH